VQIDTNPKVIPFRRDPASLAPASFPKHVPAIPVLPVTLLQLDLLRQQRSPDLSEVKQLILSDVGATLQILRVAGRELECVHECFPRLEDCICALGVEACAMTISAQVLPSNGSQPDVMQFWSHSRSVAQYCRMIAENTSAIGPDEAYLVGLLHDIGSLPGLLGWTGAGVLDRSAAGLGLAQHCFVPACVMEYFKDLHLGNGATVWSNTVRMAHVSAADPSWYVPVRPTAGTPASTPGDIAHSL
jgi:hypothetical protein